MPPIQIQIYVQIINAIGFTGSNQFKCKHSCFMKKQKVPLSNENKTEKLIFVKNVLLKMFCWQASKTKYKVWDFVII